MSTNAKLAAIGLKAAELLQISIEEAEGEILKAWEATVEDAHHNEKDPILSVGFTLKLDLGSNTLTTDLGFSVRRKYQHSAEIPDPNQPELPVGGMVTVQTGDDPPIEVTAPEFVGELRGKRKRATQN